MDYERLSKASSFSFAGTTTAQEPPRMFKNAYASQFHKSHVYSSCEHYYPNYNINNGNASSAQFHHQKGSTNGYNNNNNNNNGSSNTLINITSNTNYFSTNYPRQRFTPYYNKRSYANALMQQQQQQQTNQRTYLGYQQTNSEYENSLMVVNGCQSSSTVSCDANNNQSLALTLSNGISNGSTVMSATKNSAALNTNGNATSQDLNVSAQENSSCVTLQISNLDSTFDEHALKQHLINKLKPITSVISIYFEAISVAKIRLPSAYHAKQVISYLHRKKIGHKRITVSYTRDSSSMEPSTLRCQVVGILKVSRTNQTSFRF